MTFDPQRAISLATEALEDEERMTAGEWTGELDCFDYDEIDAIVVDPKTSMMFVAGTEVVPYRSDDRNAWTTEDSAKRDAQWAKARETQPLRDAVAIARMRNRNRATAELLRAAVERVGELERDAVVVRDGHWDEVVAERDALKAEVERLQAEVERLTKERDQARAFVVRAAKGDPAISVGELLGKLTAVEAEVERMTRERDEARGLAMEALGAIEDWPDCDMKAQHTNTIVELEALFTRLTTPSNEVLQPFRASLSPSPAAKTEGGES